MRYKTYRGKTKSEAIAKARIELGNNFIVFKEAELKAGFLGKSKEIELTVGIFENVFLQDKPEKAEDKELNDALNAIDAIDEKGSGSQLDLITVEDVEKIVGNEIPAKENNKKSVTHSGKLIDNENDGFRAYEKTIKKFLRLGDFDDNFIDEFFDIISINPSVKTVRTLNDIITNPLIFDELRKELFKYLKKKILIFNGIEASKSRSKAIAFIGPTGEGKTTTLAKLAYAFGVDQEINLKVVSLDYIRVAAKEQLSIYTQIMGQDFEYYDNLDDFRKNCDFNNNELTLIDSAGRGQKDHKELSDLRKYLNLVHIDLVKCLVLSSTKKYYDMREIIRSFDEEIGVDCIILTKLDETNSLGQAFSVLADTGKPLTYITDGQDVPNYIHKADINSLLNINFNMMLDRMNDTR